MPKRGMAWITIALAAGVVAAETMDLPACALIACAALLAAFPFVRGEARVTAAIVAAVFVVGASRYAVSREVASDDVSRFTGRIIAVEGYVVSDPEAVSDRVRLTLDVTRVEIDTGWRDASGGLMLSVYPGDKPSRRMDYGDHLRILAGPYTPFDPTNPGQFSWKGYLARQHIYACATVRDASRIKLLPHKRANILMRAALAAKRHVTRSIQRVYPKDEESLVVGMVLGTYAYLPRETLQDFSRTGTLHILAASGYNCFIVLFLAAPILRALRIVPRYGNLVMMCLLVFYLAMVGLKPSLVRATVMACLLLVGHMMKRVPNNRNLYFAAGFIILLIEPSSIFDIGFQLSFLAVWALITVSPLLESLFARAGWSVDSRKGPRKPLRALLRRICGVIGGAAVATTAITLVTTPVVAYYFNYISLVSVPANVTMALGVPVVFAAGSLAAVVEPIYMLAHFVAWVGGTFTGAMLDTVSYFGSMRYAAVSCASPGILAIAGYYVILHALLSYLRRRYAKG